MQAYHLTYLDRTGLFHLKKDLATVEMWYVEEFSQVREMKAYKNQRHMPGYFYMYKTKQLVAYESRLEMFHALSDFTEIVWEDWRTICSKAGIHVGKKGGRNRYAAVWLWCHLTEGDFRLSPALHSQDSENCRDVYARFLITILPSLEEPLQAYGIALLPRTGLSSSNK